MGCTSMVGVDDSQADKTAEREIGSLLDNGYRMTVYHHAEEKLNPGGGTETIYSCLLYTSPSPRDQRGSRMPSSA